MKRIERCAREQLATAVAPKPKFVTFWKPRFAPSGRVKLGSLLAAISRDAELSNADVEALQQQRDRPPAEPMTFE